jgi:hypothetical protein
LVVSWKLAAEMNDSDESEALVMPSKQRLAAGRASCGPCCRRSFSRRKRNLSTTAPGRNSLSPGSTDLHLAHHLPEDDLDVLVVDRDALRAIDVLDLAQQVVLHRLLAR